MFETFIARRYLRSKQKQTAISVISVIAVIGIATGVMSMIIALGITTGLSGTLEQMFLEANGHVMILERNAGAGIKDWRAISAKLRELDGVESVEPGLYDVAQLSGPINSFGVQLKGVLTGEGAPLSSLLTNLKEGSLDGLRDLDNPGIVLGSRLAENVGAVVGRPVSLLIANCRPTPFGMQPCVETVIVAGLFESGVFEFDNTWAYMSLGDVQKMFDYDDVVNSIELRLDDIYDAPLVARAAEAKLQDPNLSAVTWQEQNRRLLGTFELERRVTAITIGLIQIVAALNIFTVLVMMVMEKHRDIAILLSMGATARQIRRIFLYKGLMIGGAGTVLGMIAGYALSYFANRGQWLQIDQEIYSLAYVPIHTSWTDGVWVAAFALLVSFVAALYPANKASQIAPVESMRYE